MLGFESSISDLVDTLCDDIAQHKDQVKSLQSQTQAQQWKYFVSDYNVQADYDFFFWVHYIAILAIARSMMEFIAQAHVKNYFQIPAITKCRGEICKWKKE